MSIYEAATSIEDLLIQYKDTLKDTKKIIASLEKEIEPYKRIYDDTDQPKESRMQAKEEATPLLHDKTIYASMKNEIEFAMEWMKTGHCPNHTRGIERRASYEKEKPFDPLVMQKFFRSEENTYEWDREPKQQVIGTYDKTMVKEVLSVLTDREKEAYLLSRGHAFTQRKVADMMGVTRDSIKTMLKRAEKKIGKKVVQLKERSGA